MINKKLLLILLFIAHAAQAGVVYRVGGEGSRLRVSVVRPVGSGETRLVLRRAAYGAVPQAAEVRCDQQDLKQVGVGVWVVPKGCEKVSWEVPLADENTTLASAQQSVYKGSFILFSEASSLPRLQDAKNETLELDLPFARLLPHENKDHRINLPPLNEPPLFLLLNADEVSSLTSHHLNLTYWLDNTDGKNKLPVLRTHLSGLVLMSEWLHHTQKENFTVAWLGLSVHQMSLGGATGDHLLLANYPDDGEVDLGQTLRLYIALHEGFHQLIENKPTLPSWVSESLASYFGLQAEEDVMKHDASSMQLQQKFVNDSAKFKAGLLSINEQVKNGDQSQYGAFYTKGIAFWVEVNDALQAQGDTLAAHLPDVLNSQFDEEDNFIRLDATLHLSPRVLNSIERKYLE